uniref:Chemokine (C-C motif) receptor 12a n=1 Tax=Latimeria chalumnae TaxID=7897 RepID=H3AV97_LATCH
RMASDFETATTDAYDYEDYNDTEAVILCEKRDVAKFGAYFVPTFFHLLFIVSVFGNGLALFVLVKYEKLKTVTNIFILNLVISDLLFTFSIPFWAVYHSSEWIFGSFMCKLISGIYFVGFYSSILFLTVMTVDRYLAVVHAVSSTKFRSVCYAILASGIIWGTSVLSAVPKFIFLGTREDSNEGTLCEETGWKLFGCYQQISLYFIVPLAFIVFCYVEIGVTLIRCRMQGKQKAVKLIFIIVLVFFLCWAPYNIVTFIRCLQKCQAPTNSNCDDSFDYAFYICRNIAYFHCCVNPILYAFVGTKFRRHVSHL